MSGALRQLVVVLGDQLDANSAAFDGFEPKRDAVWMAEVAEESTYVWSSKVRTALSLSAMRHFRDALRLRGWRVIYRELGDPENLGSLAAELGRTLADPKLRPEKIVMVEPGDWRVQNALKTVADKNGVELRVRIDRHFLCTKEEFAAHTQGRKQLRMEFFYREMRRRHEVLVDAAGEPEGGQWNFDHDNRGSFGRDGPQGLRAPRRFLPDAITRTVLREVEGKFAAHPGRLEHFDWPVTRADALVALKDFVDHRLASFGEFQDAMWVEEPWLFHSRISAAMNLKLISPREVIDASVSAWKKGGAPLAAVEGFVRQILGWREYVRGIYWLFMPQYADRNALGAHEELPKFYWTGETEMACLRAAIGQTLELGYAHHIQRLMVTGLYALMLGVEPRRVHEWYLAVYVDAVEWVELPNTLGMSQYADGGVMASKPYVATGKYIERMSNYCEGCRFNPAKATGEEACPFTTLYWDFLLRHEAVLKRNQRMSLQVKNLARLSAEERKKITARAKEIRESGGAPKRAAGPAQAEMGF